MIARHPFLLEAACMSVDSAVLAYQEMKAMPKSFTCGVVQNALGIYVNGPAIGDSKPFILSGTIIKAFR